MSALRWQSVALWMILSVALSSCGLLSSKLSSALPQELAAVPGIEEVSPLPDYRLAVILNPEQERLTGWQRATIPNHTGLALNEIVFRLYPNLPQYGGQIAVGPVWVDGERRTSALRAEDSSLVITLPEPWEPEASLTISMTFDVAVPRRDSGYVLFGFSQGIWSFPDAYPLLAVHDGSRWHEDLAPAHGDAVFAQTGIYQVSLTLPPTLTLATTGSVVSDTLSVDGQRHYRIVGGPLREFTWLASADYSILETTAQGAAVRSYYLPGDEAAGQAALNTAAAALRVYADEFGPYPFPEMTVIEAPLGFYGMEYPGLNLIGLDLYRSQRAELQDRVAHEIAHQWWYSQVGSDQVNTPWLDEGLAEYSTATYYRRVYGDARANRLVNQRWLVPYQVAVAEGRDAVVNQPSAAFGTEYEVIVYGKAALFFDALWHELGAETYQRVMREYVARYRWRIATPDDFLDVAEEVSGQDLDGLYNHWILSKQ
jgi:hypothetical protein